LRAGDPGAMEDVLETESVVEEYGFPVMLVRVGCLD
jgi:hypothetical protein